MKNLAIVVVIAIGLLGGWRWYAGRVDMSKPESVATAFLKALRTENLEKAGQYYVPAGTEAWQTSAKTALGQMASGSHDRFMEDLTTKYEFTATHNPKSPANETTLTSNSTSLDMRQIDGKWYVCKSPL